MPVALRQIKKELESDRNKKGRFPDGDYKFTPPNMVSRKFTEYKKLKVTKLTSSPKPGLNAVSYTAVVASQDTPGVKYKTSIQFHDMQFRDKKSENLYKNEHEYMNDGKVKKVYYRTANVNDNKVMLKCSCKDFQHRFETELYEADGLIGAPRKYRRKTPPWPVGRPYANTTEKLGICKHLYSMLEHLKAKELLKEK